jgi:signal transduction histidine kinase
MNFVAGVSHELRTPLTVIRTAAFNLRRSPSLSGPQNAERAEQYGTLIEDESVRLSALVEQVLQFGSASNRQASRPGVAVAVETLIDEVLQASRLDARTPAVELDKDIALGLPPLAADPVALRHALQNLVDNALKYGAGEGSTWLGVSAALVVDKGGRWIEIRVADHGPGIPREERGRVFEPFFRGRRAIEDQIHGTGLGLNLVKKIVDAQGGSIRLESAPGAGTAFIVRIPTAAEGTAA